jgi:O-antigen ligase
LYFVWLMLLFQPHWWIVSLGALWARRVPTLLLALLALLLLIRLKVREWYFPLLMLVLFAVLTTPFAVNPAYAKEPAKALLLYWLVAIATLSLVRTPRQAIPILLMLGVFQFAWWGALGAKNGLVSWHPVLGNYDDFGAAMVIGMACALGFGFAARSRPLRYFGFAVAAVCAAGVVSSFARGAFLAAAFVMAFMLYRSPNKRAAAAGVALAAGAVALAAMVLFGDAGVRAEGKGTNTAHTFFAEIGTISRDFNAGTGADRRVLWRAAWEVFLQHPVLGVGAENFGPFAAGYFRPGTVGGIYAKNPATLYDRKLHNGYFQSLSEFGTVGTLLFVLLVVDFWKRNGALRTQRYRAAWDAATGGRYDLRWLALGLESGMVAVCASAVFYNQLFEPWLYVLLTANILLQSQLRRALQPPVVLAAPRVGRA